MDQRSSVRFGDWMTTWSGGTFWPLDPASHEIKIDDIAHALSNICRFGGHSKRFYSVAQHSVLASIYVNGDAEVKKWALLHDAAEAYVGDMVRPLKSQMPTFQNVERGIMVHVAEAFGLSWGIPEAVKEIDEILLATEAWELMPRQCVERWSLKHPRAERIKIAPVGPEKAQDLFLKEYEKLFGRRA